MHTQAPCAPEVGVAMRVVRVSTQHVRRHTELNRAVLPSPRLCIERRPHQLDPTLPHQLYPVRELVATLLQRPGCVHPAGVVSSPSGRAVHPAGDTLSAGGRSRRTTRVKMRGTGVARTAV
jgi:hypothetical protein